MGPGDEAKVLEVYDDGTVLVEINGARVRCSLTIRDNGLRRSALIVPLDDNVVFGPRAEN